MNAETALALAQETLWLVVKLGAPPLLAGLIVGLLVSVVQTATTIQDSTLTQVPKMVATLFTILLSFNWIVSELTHFVQRVTSLIGAA